MTSFGALINKSLGNAPKEELTSVTPTAAKKEEKKGGWLDAYTVPEPDPRDLMTKEEKQRLDLKACPAWTKLAEGLMHTITEDDVKTIFEILDLDSDGTLSREEIMGAFHNVAGDDDDGVCDTLDKILNTTDVDDNAIDCEDLRQAIRLGHENHAKEMTLKLQGHDPAEGDWIWRDKLIEYLKMRKEMYENCKSLPVTLFFFVLFFYLASGHLMQKELHLLNTSISGDLNINDDRLADGFPETAKVIVHNQIRKPFVASYNQIIGGWRVSKILPDTEPQGPLCALPIQEYFSKRMSGDFEPMEPKTCEPNWGNKTTAWMLWALKSEDSLAHLGERAFWGEANKGWPDFATSPAVEGIHIDGVTYNEQMSMYTVIHYSINILPSGYVKVSKKIESIIAHPAWLTINEDIKHEDKRGLVMVGIVYVILFVLVGMGEFLEYIQFVCTYGPLRGTRLYVNFWNFIDWSNIIMVGLIMVYYFYCVHLTSGFNALVTGVKQLDPTVEYTLPGLEYALNSTVVSYTAQLNQIVQQGEVLVAAYFDLKWYISVFSIFSALRFFKAFRANPRLNCVTQTLVRSFPDLSHFMLVFLSLLMAFVLIGHLLFGSRIEDFSTTAKAVNTCFLFLLCYAFDPLAPEMYEHGGVLGFIWAWSFNIGMVLLLLNMVLAIVFDVYSEVKSGVGDAPSLAQQTTEVLQEIRGRGAKRRQMLASVQDHVMAKGEAEFEATGERNIDNPMDGDWQKAGEEVLCATIYGSSLIWATGDTIPLELNAKGTEAGFKTAAGNFVTMKLDAQDPERPILIFAGGDIWEKCADQSPQFTSKKKKQKSFKHKGDWSENDLLAALDAHHAHPGEIVSGSTLAKAVEANLIQEKQLEGIIQSALASSAEDAANQEVSLSDSIRLVCRIDTNVRSAVRLKQNQPSEELSQEEEKDIAEAEERMTQLETALGTINAQLDRIIGGRMRPNPATMKM